MSSTETAEMVICRACIKECTDYKSLHKRGIILGEVTTLAYLLSFCIGLDFTVPEEEQEQEQQQQITNALPSSICMSCIQSLAKTYAFKKMVLESNEILCKQHDELHDAIVIQQQFISDEVSIDDEELQELANAAEMKQTLDNMEYMTVTMLDSNDGECDPEQTVIESTEMLETEDEDEQCAESIEVHEIVEGITEIYTSDNDEDERTDATIEHEEDDDSQQERIKLELDSEGAESFEALSYEITLQNEEESDGTITQAHTARKRRRDSKEQQSDNELLEHIPKRSFKTRNKSAQPKPANPSLQCPICGKQLSNPNSFKYHMQLHSDATPFLCSLCGEGFKTRNAYEGHMIIHDPNNPNTCELCGKSYRQSSSLRTHMLTHTGERPYQCDICGKGMTQKSGYKKHMLIHTGEKPHVCDICGREFRYSSNLIAHKRCHSGEKPYECTHCSKTFPTSEQMKRHMLVHTGERPFPCELCGKSFKRRSSLLTHRHTHETGPELIEQKLSKSNVVELY